MLNKPGPPPLAKLPVTDWLKEDAPFRPGPYQVLVSESCPDEGALIGYQYWTGDYWGTFAPTAQLAEEFKVTKSYFQSPVWRGLNNAPSVLV